MAPIKLRGTIKSLKKAEGFGFLTHAATGIDYFFHRSVIIPADQWDSLRSNQAVEFIPEDGPKGPRASDVFLV